LATKGKRRRKRRPVKEREVLELVKTSQRKHKNK
jgi:hypothetical protein